MFLILRLHSFLLHLYLVSLALPDIEKYPLSFSIPTCRCEHACDNFASIGVSPAPNATLQNASAHNINGHVTPIPGSWVGPCFGRDIAATKFRLEEQPGSTGTDCAT